jgi:hypothetical protein
VPGGVAVLRCRLLLSTNAGVGDDNVDPAKIVDHSLHRLTDPIGVRHVDDSRMGGAAIRLQLGRCRLQCLDVQVPHRHSCT